MPDIPVTEHVISKNGHTTFYLAAGPEDGPLIIFTHGWPELSLSWRHQLKFFGAMGARAIAPDMRGYGRSSIYSAHEDYTLEYAVADMITLLDSIGAEKAIWIGHDWGSPVACSVAAHHPDRCHGVASLCVPYATLEQGIDPVIALVDRSLYPADRYPAGQWEYMRFYEEQFTAATKPMDADPLAMIRLLFRKADPAGFGQPSATALVREQGGWFGGQDRAPFVPRDADVISEEELSQYASRLAQNGFFGPNSWYMNHDRNAAWFQTLPDEGKLDTPFLFIAAQYDATCESITSRLTQPMREKCSNLSETVVFSGHWMAQEQPAAVNRALIGWMLEKLPAGAI